MTASAKNMILYLHVYLHLRTHICTYHIYMHQFTYVYIHIYVCVCTNHTHIVQRQTPRNLSSPTNSNSQTRRDTMPSNKERIHEVKLLKPSQNQFQVGTTHFPRLPAPRISDKWGSMSRIPGEADYSQNDHQSGLD